LEEKRSKRLEIRIEPSLFDVLENMAIDNDQNVSTFVRTLLQKEAKKYRREQQKIHIHRSKM
jgi:uncharacterized protein (DUF1778 family)